MEYLKNLKALKEERDLTNAEIAELSDVPLATVTRIFNGSTPNPQFETIARITIALGGSLDVIAGLKAPDEPQPVPVVSQTFASYAELLKGKDELIQELKEDKKHSRRTMAKLLIFFGIFAGFVLLLLAVDVLNGHFGYFRY